MSWQVNGLTGWQVSLSDFKLLTFLILHNESTWKNQELSSNSKHAYILSYSIFYKLIYKDRIYDIATEIRLLIYKMKVVFLKSHFFKWTP